MEYLSFPLHVKTVDERGRWSGYASTFGNRDLQDDVVERGAFAESLKETAGKIPILNAHRSDQLIGFGVAASEDKEGLRIEAEFTLDSTGGRDAHAWASHARKLGIPLGLSIGYSVREGGSHMKGGTRYLTNLSLMEVSIAPLPANPQARITSVKEKRMETTDLSEFTDVLNKLTDKLNAGKPTGETLVKFGKIDESLTDVHKKQTANVDRLDAIEVKMNRKPSEPLPGGGESLSSLFMDSREWRQFQSARQPGKVRWEVQRKDFTRTTVPLPPVFGGLTGFAHAPTTMRSILPTVPVTSGAVSYLRATTKTVTGSIVQVAEGDVKAKAAWSYVKEDAYIVTFSEWAKVSVQSDEDVPALRQAIDEELMAEVAAEEENELLNGAGTTGHMQGFITAAPVFAGGVAGDTVVNVIQRAIAQLGGLGYRTTAVVLPVSGALAVALLKDTTGRQLYPNAAALPWPATTVISPKMPTGKFLAGDFQGYSTLLDRGEQLDVGTVDDDFIRNLLSIRYDRRFGLAIRRVEAFLQGSLTPPV